MLRHTKLHTKNTIDNDTKDKMAIRKYLGILRNDKRKSSHENVFRLSTLLPNGMSYAEFALYYTRRNKKTNTASDGRACGEGFKSRTKKSFIFTDADLALNIPETRRMKKQSDNLSDCFRDVVGDPNKVKVDAFYTSKDITLSKPIDMKHNIDDNGSNKKAKNVYTKKTSKKRAHDITNMSNIIHEMLVKKQRCHK